MIPSPEQVVFFNSVRDRLTSLFYRMGATTYVVKDTDRQEVYVHISRPTIQEWMDDLDRHLYDNYNWDVIMKWCNEIWRMIHELS